MTLPKISTISGQAVYVPGNDIDTDRIIPARFMKCVTFDGLGEYLFHDIRYDEDGSEKNHSLNDPKFKDSSIMISDINFGCGSSREHAPQSLFRAGFRAIVAGNFAEIFFGNATNLGIPCVSMGDTDRKCLVEMIESTPDATVSVDISVLKVRIGETVLPCELRDGAKDSLLNGRWDPLDELLQAKEEVEQRSRSLFYV
jgi:3-isopropylmalate/(R)-2-methylmalate dehydratase small subunit